MASKYFGIPSVGMLAISLMACAQAQGQSPAGRGTDTGAVLADLKTAAPAGKVEIVGTAESYDARRDDTATKIVVNRAEIDRYGDSTLGDVLKRQPDITIHGGTPGSGGGEIRMRGLGAGYTQVLLDGLPAPAGFSIDSLPPNQVERIEIIRAATAEFSTRAIAGTINVVMRSKVTSGQVDGKLSAEASDVSGAGIANIQFSDKFGKFSYLMSANLRAGKYDITSERLHQANDARGELLYAHEGVRGSEASFQMLNLAPRLVWTLADGGSVVSQTSVSLNRLRLDTDMRWTTLSGYPSVYDLETTQGTAKADQLRSDLTWTQKKASGVKTELKAVFSASRGENDSYDEASDAPALTFLDRSVHTVNHQHDLTLQGKLSMPLVTNHTFATGWETGTSRRRESNTQRIDRSSVTTFRPFNENATVRSNRLALFAQDEWAITPKLMTYFGVRWEGIEVSSEGSAYDDINNRSSVVSPIFQTLWKLPNSTKDQLRFALSRTYKTQSLSMLASRREFVTNNGPSNPDTEGNPTLRPALATGVDLSYEHFASGGATFSISAYHRRITNATLDELIFSDGRWVRRPVNGGKARTSGVAVDMKLPLRSIWKSAPNVDVRANVNRDWSSVDSIPGPRNRLADQTPLSSTVSVNYLASTAWEMGASFAFRTAGLSRVSRSYSNYATVRRNLDFHALWKLAAKQQVRFAVSDALAQDRYKSTRFADAAGSTETKTFVHDRASFRVTWEQKW